jgi:sirohydrochlorin ferrochelatase
MPIHAASIGIILFAHGSRVETANQSVRELASQVQGAGPYDYVRASFLELGTPDLQSAVRQAVADGRKRLIVLPYFLTLGLHLERDLPRLVQEARAAFPEADITVGESLDGHPNMVSVLLERAREAAAEVKPAS